ncbi:MAG TPA: hypothetical protein VND22_01445 [Actinomycetota bacterium]|nr:hypothetical protein [Actinomycetota bacterium]
MSAREPELETGPEEKPREAVPAETPLQFVRSRPGVEGSIMHIGLHTAQLILVAETGEWIRYVFPTVEDAKDACERLKIEGHDGFPDHLRQRMGKYKRSPEDWKEAPYPERQRGTSV